MRLTIILLLYYPEYIESPTIAYRKLTVLLFVSIWNTIFLIQIMKGLHRSGVNMSLNIHNYYAKYYKTLSFDLLWSKTSGPDKLSVHLGIYRTRFSSIAFFQKQLLNNIFLPTYIFEIALVPNLCYGRSSQIEVTISTFPKCFSQ